MSLKGAFLTAMALEAVAANKDNKPEYSSEFTKFMYQSGLDNNMLGQAGAPIPQDQHRTYMYLAFECGRELGRLEGLDARFDVSGSPKIDYVAIVNALAERPESE